MNIAAPKNILIRIVSIACVALATAHSLHAATIYKANNTANLNTTGAWTNNVVPGASDIAVWDNNVPGANTTLLGASMTWAGVRILDPGGLVTISAGSTLTVGPNGIDLSAATQNLTLNNGVTIGVGGLQKWNVQAGRTLTLAAVPTKPTTPNTSNSGGVQISTTGTVKLGTVASALLIDAGNNPYATLGVSDWAALDSSGNVIAATYTDASTALTAGVINNIIGDFNIGATIDVSAMRFNDATPHTNTITGTSTLTARGILVTPNSGGGTIAGATAFIRPNRVSTAGASIEVFQNSAADFAINARLADASSSTPVHLVKFGPGNLILGNAGNSIRGGTTINGGTLTVSAGASLSSGPITVNLGRLVIFTNALINSSATLNSGTTNTLRITAANGQVFHATNLIFTAGSTRMEFNYNNGVPMSTTSAALVTGNLTVSNSVTIDILSGNPAVGVFPLIKYTNSLAGNGFSAFSLGVLPLRTSGYLSNDTVNSSIDLVVTSVNEPLKWAAASGTWDIGSTPNWVDPTLAVTTYQEANGLGDSVVFEDSVSGTSPITVTLNAIATPAGVTVSAAKNYTLSGSGSVVGPGGLTKSGSGTLTLSTANGFTGGLSINNGIVSFSALTNLGGGAISFGGGTLQYTANSDDISVRTVSLNAGGGSIDTAANTVSYAGPIGNNSAGGLTKLGSGTLTLNGTNRYSGNTLVNEGILALGGSSYLSNSAAIMVASSAVLDTASSGIGLTLRSTVNQILGGAGTVSGIVTVPPSTTVTPATNGTAGTLTISGDLQMSGGTIVYDVSTTARDLIVANNLTLSSGFLQVAATEALTNGVYKVIQYSGTISGLAANIQITGFSQANKAASLSDTTPGEIDLIIGNGRGTNLVWQGDGVNNYWNELGEFNWTNSTGTPMQFISLDKVTFDDTSVNTTVNLTNVVQPGAVTVNATASYTFQDSGTGAGKISGATGLTKSGSGTLTILTPNNNSGPTVVNGGTLQVGNGGTTGDIGSGNITNNAAIVFAQTDDRLVAGAISGTGTLTQQGSARLALAQNNTFSGGTTISSGALQIGNGGGAGSLGTGPVVDNSTLSFNRSGTHSLTNTISGSGMLSKNGSATMTLQGNFTYQGNTFISNGIAKLGAPEQIPDGLNVAGSTGWLILDGSDAAAGVFDLNGFNETVNALSGLFGATSGAITNSAGGAGTNILTVLGTAGTTYAGLITENPTGAKVSLVLHGGSELRLNGANTYTGGTYVGDTATIGVGPGGSIGAASSRLVLSNGTTLLIHNNGGTGGFSGNAVTIPDNSQATITSSQLGNGFTGTVTGSASTTNLIVGPVSFSAQGVMQHQPFNGLVLVQAGAELRFSNTQTITEGGTNATFEVEGTMHMRNNGTATLGALTGNGIINNPTVSGTGNWIVGTKGIDSAYTGEFSGANTLTKSGAGKLTLSGTVSHTGNTTVSNGVLVLATDTAVLDGSPVISVKTGASLDVSARTDGALNLGNSIAQTLSGSGTILGNVNAGANSLVSPGDSIGTLTVTNTVTLAGTNIMELNRTNLPVNCDRIVSPSITASGTLIVSNIGPVLQGGDTFQLYNTPVSGAFASVSLPTLTGSLYWTNTLTINGSIAVVNPVNTAPPFITNGIAGNTLTLTWPADHTGWQLQSNSVAVNNASQWFTVPGSTTTNQVSIAINPAAPKVFFRLAYP